MKERPILFNGDMVRAILDGSKTQTRRVVKTMNNNRLEVKVGGKWRQIHAADPNLPCPYGQPGDRLWVRETWSKEGLHPDECYYRATPYGLTSGEVDQIKWKPSIHMPRWASRITLEIVSVRVERLNDISEQDAVAEGIEPIIDNSPFCGARCWKDYMNQQSLPFDSDKPVASFMSLWKSVYGEESWQQNPWCWVVEFKMVQP